MKARRFLLQIPLLIILLTILSACQPRPQKALISEGTSNGCIVLAASDSLTLHAAEQMQYYLKEATGAYFPIVPETRPLTGPHIVIGWADETLTMAPDLKPDSFIWHSEKSDQLLIGGPGHGTLYGVYAFLEKYLNIHCLTPEVTIIPKSSDFKLPRVHEIRQPAFPVRWLWLPGSSNQFWCDWHGIHSRQHHKNSWGMFVHTFNKLVPPDEYFADHPEYFSEIKGVRLANQQLCLTNSHVFDLVIESLRKKMAQNPQAWLWSVSQNDCFGPCECTNCQALVDKYKSQSGPLLFFVNRIAAKFPDKTISTLAYQYTRQAPQGLKPAPNVNICLCSIECDRSEAFASDGRNADFLRDIRQWRTLTENLMIWDYVVQFTNYVAPFPNFHVLQPNIRILRDNQVKIMFQQGSSTSKSDLSELKQYVIAKLLWNPDLPVDSLIDEFLAGFYAEAAPDVRRYMNLMQKRLLNSGARLEIFGNPVNESNTWLTPETLADAEKILAVAEQKVAEKPEFRDRVRKVRLSLAYAALEQGKLFGAQPHGYFEKNPAGRWQVKPHWPPDLDRFVAGCETAGLTTLHERNYSPAAYKNDILKFFSQGMVNHLAQGKPVSFSVPFSSRYPASGANTLVDGIKGINDYKYSWLGWEATDMTLTVDIEETQQVSRLAADFLQVTASWTWLPREIIWSTSCDGNTWESAAILRPGNPEDRTDPFIERFECSFKPRLARYIRLKATGMKHCPDWHHGSGGDAWMFCDEVMVFAPDTEAETPKAERMRWFRQAKLGIFIHWGIYAVNGIGESWSFHNGHISHEDYMAQLSGFSAENYNPEQWAALIKDSGAKYAVLTAKHHDGVALWDSEITKLNVVEKTPAGRDLIAPFVQALRKQDLKVGLYYSLIDWSDPDYPNFLRNKKRYENDPLRWARFSRSNHGQIKELSKIFNPDLFWFDGDWEQSAEKWQAAKIRTLLLNRNPATIINSRLQGYGDYATPEQGVPIQRPEAPYWELCLTMNTSWGFQPEDHNYKSTNQIIRILVECISMGGNLLLDIGPRPDGTICAEQTKILKELGRWTGKHAEAIYGTEAGLPAGHFYGPTALSADRKTLFLYLTHQPIGPLMLKGIANKIESVRIVGPETKLKWDIQMKLSWSKVPGIIYIDVPAETLDPEVTVLAIKLDGPIALFRDGVSVVESN